MYTRVSNGMGQRNFSGQRDRKSFLVPGQRDNGTSPKYVLGRDGTGFWPSVPSRPGTGHGTTFFFTIIVIPFCLDFNEYLFSQEKSVFLVKYLSNFISLLGNLTTHIALFWSEGWLNSIGLSTQKSDPKHKNCTQGIQDLWQSLFIVSW